MVNTNILLSKIVANATDRTWSQAYSTLNLYIVLSIESQTIEEETIATHGKEILERMQREFFALDEKNLDTIKNAVESTIKAIPHSLEYSILLAIIQENILYIVVASNGMVVIKRNTDIGIVASGEEKKILGFSGFLKDHDTIIIGTPDFFKKVPLGHLKTLLHKETVTAQAENLAPIIHGNSRGTEAAMLLQFRHHEKKLENESASAHSIEEMPQEDIPKTSKRKLSLPSLTLPISSLFSKNMATKLLKNKFALVTLCVILLVVILAVSIVYERKKANNASNQVLLESILTSAQKKYDDATTLASLNKALALDELNQDRDSLQKDREKFPAGSPEQKKIDELLAKINSSLGQGPESAANLKNQKILIDPAKNQDIKQIGRVTYKGQAVAVIDSNTGTVYVISKDDGTIQAKIPTDAKNPKQLTGDKNIIYILADSTYKIDIGAKKSTKIFDVPDSSNIVSFDTFAGNLYLLNKSDKSITKYLPGSSTGSSYLIAGASIAHTPTSLSIDSSLWVGEEGTVERFTKGKSDPLTIKGLTKPLGNKVFTYTDQDYNNVYILDTANGRIVSIDKTGVFSNQYSNKILLTATSFAVDEVSKRMFVVSGNKLYSFDF